MSDLIRVEEVISLIKYMVDNKETWHDGFIDPDDLIIKIKEALAHER